MSVPLPLIVVVIATLLNFNCLGMGSGTFCKWFPKDPSCKPAEPKLFTLDVIKGSNSGKYKERDEIKSSANKPGPREVFAGWSGDTDFIKDPKAQDILIIMPAKDIRIQAEYQIGPTDPCEIDPASCQPKPDGFDWTKVKQWGGPNIHLPFDIQTWKVTSELKSVSFSGSLLKQDRDTFKPVPCKDDLQGNFNACVKQPDNLYVCGSWDWERCGGQAGGKTIENLKGEIGKSFNLKKGMEICFFNSGLARSSARNKEIRTSVRCTTWPY